MRPLDRVVRLAAFFITERPSLVEGSASADVVATNLKVLSYIAWHQFLYLFGGPVTVCRITEVEVVGAPEVVNAVHEVDGLDLAVEEFGITQQYVANVDGEADDSNRD